jgi:hypothetical protein
MKNNFKIKKKKDFIENVFDVFAHMGNQQRRKTVDGFPATFRGGLRNFGRGQAI